MDYHLVGCEIKTSSQSIFIYGHERYTHRQGLLHEGQTPRHVEYDGASSLHMSALRFSDRDSLTATL